MQEQEEVVAAAGVFKALGSPIRLAIMRRLSAEEEVRACDFHEVFELAQPTVSQHLKVLREAGLVHTRRAGNTISYSLSTEGLRRAEAELGVLYPVRTSAPPASVL
ncbi:ArsR/SmtB family transcription factor [Sciscionella marina]|uniref:ArsR/SmtB family transcription factor n=1 Tax=Sciscionella marina TaxID=508770 RepID=UPI00036FCC44|nr:metalloregulator ArsR/SmtB family transcription factor [Sciscionella marina]